MITIKTNGEKTSTTKLYHIITLDMRIAHEEI